MSRHCDLSNVHFFSLHFFTTLSVEGPQAVTKWTKNKGIDVFDKKFLFFVINQSLHWSLCVVVNPGFIKEHTKFSEDDFDEEKGFDPNAPMPHMLFFDSLKAHRKGRITKYIRTWLNSEWKRLNKSSDPEPFTEDLMRVHDPKSEYHTIYDVVICMP
jgi:Ulp1 family protease